MKKMLALLICFGFFGLTSCSKVSNEFIIKDPENVASSAELLLCNKQLKLTKNESEIKGKMSITCEGEGIILVHLLNGRLAVCRIGYVTPGAAASFEFRIEQGQCK